MTSNDFAQTVFSKALFRSGLIFRGAESGIDHDNIRLHETEISEIIQPTRDAENRCDTCRDYGLEYLHLLECPDTFKNEKKYDSSISPYRSRSPSPETVSWQHENFEAIRPVHTSYAWVQGFDVREDFRHDCSVCKLLSSLVPEDLPGPWRIGWVGYGYYRMDDDSRNWGRRSDFINWHTQRTPGIFVAPNETAAFEEWWKDRRKYGLVLPTRKSNEDPTIPRARLINADAVNFDAAKSWIQTCRKKHGYACNDTAMTAGPSLVIDCHTKAVVPTPENCEYVALSYVWGSDPTHIPTDLSQINQVPILVQDALVATISLGYDYLWIDYYCVPQDDEAAKHTEIHKMDQVYTGAQITIIAAASENPYTGLPGMGTVSRESPLSAMVGNNTLVAIYARELDSITQSLWNSRGWTYQEALLSRRRLVFITTGMYFQCMGGSPSEICARESWDVELGTKGMRSILNEPSFFPPIDQFTDLSETVWRCLRTYTTRALSYESDAISAFAGILNWFATKSEHFDHIWGLPVYRRRLKHDFFTGDVSTFKDYDVPQTFSEQIASCLLWRAAERNYKLGRRPDFPSWSWASTRGVITCEGENVRNLDLEISIEIEGEEEPFTADDYFSIPAEHRPRPTGGLYINCPTTYIEVETPVIRNGTPLSATSFERRDGIKLSHLTLMDINRWPKGFVQGRHLAIILGASQRTMTLRLEYHLLVLHEKEGYYERAFVLKVNDESLQQEIPEETWSHWRAEQVEVLKIDKVPFIWEDYTADFGFKEEDRENWEKVFLMPKHLNVEKRSICLR